MLRSDRNITERMFEQNVTKVRSHFPALGLTAITD